MKIVSRRGFGTIKGDITPILFERKLVLFILGENHKRYESGIKLKYYYGIDLIRLVYRRN